MLGRWDERFVQQHGEDAYRPYVSEATQLLTSSGAHVLWLSMLAGAKDQRTDGQDTYQQLPARFPGQVDYWDFTGVLHGPDGGWPMTVVEPNGRTALLRKPDQLHLCPAGAQRVAESVLGRAVALGWSRRAAGPWQSGSWRQHPRYDSPHGGCVLPPA
jgi:hypothetical protein